MRKLTAPFLTLMLLGSNCDDGNGSYEGKDAGGNEIPGLSYADIATPCTYDPQQPSVNPSNTCKKSGLTCVLSSSDGMYSYGSLLYESIPLFTRFLANGKDEGSCTLVTTGLQLACPLGSYAVKLSSGHTICMRGCGSTADCQRDGFVCDYRFMDASSYNAATGAVSPLALKLCVPSCQTDLPYCMRTFLAKDANGADMLIVYDGDLRGNRECSTVTGMCSDVAARGGRYVGDTCTHSSECGANLLCIGGPLYGAAEEHGFCTSLCDPSKATPQEAGCAVGETCELFFSVGYCFPDCGTGVCAGVNQVCQFADPNKAGLGAGQQWRYQQCIPCELSSLPCGNSADAGVGIDATASDAARDGG